MDASRAARERDNLQAHPTDLVFCRMFSLTRHLKSSPTDFDFNLGGQLEILGLEQEPLDLENGSCSATGATSAGVTLHGETAFHESATELEPCELQPPRSRPSSAVSGSAMVESHYDSGGRQVRAVQSSSLPLSGFALEMETQRGQVMYSKSEAHFSALPTPLGQPSGEAAFLQETEMGPQKHSPHRGRRGAPTFGRNEPSDPPVRPGKHSWQSADHHRQVIGTPSWRQSKSPQRRSFTSFHRSSQPSTPSSEFSSDRSAQESSQSPFVDTPARSSNTSRSPVRSRSKRGSRSPDPKRRRPPSASAWQSSNNRSRNDDLDAPSSDVEEPDDWQQGQTEFNISPSMRRQHKRSD
eukprot:GHVN01050524.1.p2 GENE.GHVN01050524.1~~GHVN01050524.1.p2  ORF type:complete len:353 (-),score=46.04 GHVN01050524.1:1122-2180(-)